MVEGFLFFKCAEEGIEYTLCRQCSSKRHITASNAFGQGHEIWRHPFVFAGKEFTSTTKACGYFIDNEEYIMFRS